LLVVQRARSGQSRQAVPKLTLQQLVSLDRELHRIFGLRYPYRNTEATSYGGGFGSATATYVAKLGVARETDSATDLHVDSTSHQHTAAGAVVEPAEGKAHFVLPLRMSATAEAPPITGSVASVAPAARSAGSGTVSQPRPEIRAILASGLPEAVQAELIDYAIDRQHQLGMQLFDEIRRLIGIIQAAFPVQHEGEGHGVGT
jgi:hypothetical protein